MSQESSALKRLLIAGAAVSGVAFTAAPAAAEYYELSYSGGGGVSGTIWFYETNNVVTSIAGGSVNTGSGNVAVSNQYPETQNSVATPVLGLNNNQVLNFTAGAAAAPHFTTGGLAFMVGGQVVDLYSKGAVGPVAAQDVEISGPAGAGGSPGFTNLSTGYTPNDVTVTSIQDLGAPGPVPGNGTPALGMLVALGAMLKFRGRFAR